MLQALLVPGVLKHAIANAERVHKLPVVQAKNITNGSGGLGNIFSGEFNGKPAIFKYDKTVDYDAIAEIEKVTKELEPYGGPRFYDRVRIQESNGVWREAVAMERVEGHDMNALKRLADRNETLPIEVTSMHLKAIDDLINKLAKEGKVLTETNLGDFMLTNDPQRPIVLLDMFVRTGARTDQGVLDENGAPVREAIEALIKKSKTDVPSIPTGFKYQFEKEGYAYSSTPDMRTDGTLTITHSLKKEDGSIIPCGASTITNEGVLENMFEIRESLKNKEISKAMYSRVLNEDVKSISSFYGAQGRFGLISDNYVAFMKEYNISKDPVKAALATPEGKVLGNDWEPVNIQIKEDDVSMQWVKKGTATPSPRTGFKYDFEKDGYVYKATQQVLPGGIKRIFHAIKKEGENELPCGVSELTKEGELYNALKIPEKMRKREVSKAIYARVLNEDIKSIPTVYVDGGIVGASDNYAEFIKEYEKSKDALKAILATPEGKVLGKDWEPADIQVGKSVSFVWIKKGTGGSELNEPWINSLPAGLRAQLFAEKDEMYDLFKSVDANERARLAKSWEVLKNAAGLYYQVPMVI